MLSARTSCATEDPAQTISAAHPLVNWIRSNVSPKTGLPYSFQIPEEHRPETYSQMGSEYAVSSIIERVIVEEGLVIYDGAVGQIALTWFGSGDEDLKWADRPLNVYWNGHFNQLSNLRAGYPVNQFIYDPTQPDAVSSDIGAEGKRGFIFRIIDADGQYLTADPLTGDTYHPEFPVWPQIHWEDWKPVAGENAWVAMAALHLFHRRALIPSAHGYQSKPSSVELKLAEELARAALILQSETGGIRMAPIGTYRGPEDATPEQIQNNSWWYDQISSENNISWYAAFRMLFDVTGDEQYRRAMEDIEIYFHSVFDSDQKYFYQGKHFSEGEWLPNDEHFALDVQTWGILAFGPQKIDEWFGEGTAFAIWQTARRMSGVFDATGGLSGVGYTRENDRLSVEWTAGAIMAVRELARYYQDTQDWYDMLTQDERAMRQGVETLRHDFPNGQTAYSYSSRRGWIPFGWYSHSPEVLSLASTGWILFVDSGFNPFQLPK